MIEVYAALIVVNIFAASYMVLKKQSGWLMLLCWLWVFMFLGKWGQWI